MPSMLDDADSFAAALRGHAPKVLGYLGRLLGDANEAEDVWQEAQLLALKSRAQLRDELSLRPWVYRIAYNLALAVLRRRAAVGGEGEELDVLPAQSTRRSTDQAVRTTNKRTLRELIDDLPPLDKTLVVLRVDRELAWDEVAAVLDVTAVNARKRFSRLIRELRQGFDDRDLLPRSDERR